MTKQLRTSTTLVIVGLVGIIVCLVGRTATTSPPTNANAKDLIRGATTADDNVASKGPSVIVLIERGIPASSAADEYRYPVLQETASSLDIAIDGDGFFKVTLPSGIFYTRHGSFHTNVFGDIVNAEGFPLADGICIPSEAEDVAIGIDGVVSATIAGQLVQVGRMQIYKFADSTGLQRIKDKLYAATEESGPELPGLPSADGFGALRQRYIELSSADLTLRLLTECKPQIYEVDAFDVRGLKALVANTRHLVR